MSVSWPARNALCRCGSHLKFKRCCGTLPELNGVCNDNYRRAVRAGDLREALRQSRGMVTWYWTMHLEHTVPWVRRDPVAAEPILVIDIEALADCIVCLIDAHLRLSMDSVLSSVIPTFEHAIADPRWLAHYRLFCVLVALGREWNQARAAAVLKGFYPRPEGIENFTLLTMYYHFFDNELSAFSRLRLAERLAAMAERPVDRLHYRFAYELSLLMLHDNEGLVDRLADHIADFRADTKGKVLSDEEADWLSEALSTWAFFANTDEALQEAEIATQELLASSHARIDGARDIYRRLGEISKRREDYARAAAHFQAAYTYGHSARDIMFAAECLLYARDIDTARRLFDRVEYHNLHSSGKLDYALILPGFALESNDVGDLERARSLLLSTPFGDPYFHEQQISGLRFVNDRLTQLCTNTPVPIALPRYKRALRWISQFAELKPNIMGLGVNFNAVLDSVVAEGAAAHGVVERPGKETKTSDG
jgi:tetratricopeptide (TPR) repeat protein